MNIIELRNDQEIYSYLDELDKRGRKVIAVDIEAEFNLHCYGEHLCLIQIFDLENGIIIDPFRFRKSQSIKRLFEKRDLLKIMYDSLGDASLLENEYGFRPRSILDLKPAVSLLNYPKQSLAHILGEELGIAVMNKKKFQKYNWMRRPINKEAIEYAVGDVKHLFALKDVLIDKLRTNGLLDTYILHNLMIQDGTGNKNKKAKCEKAKGYDRLNTDQKEMFRELFGLRDAFAKRLNKPPDYVFRNADLLELCRKEIHEREFIEHSINQKIERSMHDEILGRFSEIIEHRLGKTDDKQ